MKKLIDDKGKLIQESILIETYNFYSKLYQTNQVETMDWNDLANLNVPKLNTQLRDSLEGPLLMDEVFEVIRNMNTINLLVWMALQWNSLSSFGIT